jgi:hypothetical protein
VTLFHTHVHVVFRKNRFALLHRGCDAALSTSLLRLVVAPSVHSLSALTLLSSASPHTASASTVVLWISRHFVAPFSLSLSSFSLSSLFPSCPPPFSVMVGSFTPQLTASTRSVVVLTVLGKLHSPLSTLSVYSRGTLPHSARSTLKLSIRPSLHY